MPNYNKVNTYFTLIIFCYFISYSIFSFSHENSSIDNMINLNPRWNWQDLGTHIGHNIMEAVDVDNDGLKEMILGANGVGFDPGKSVVVLETNLLSTKCLINFPSVHYS